MSKDYPQYLLRIIFLMKQKIEVVGAPE